MKKYHLFFLSLLIVFIGVIGLTSSVLAAPSDEKVEVIINTRQKEGEKVQEIVYNTKRETNTIYGLTASNQLLHYQERGAMHFIVWNTLHSQFDVEEGVYIVGSDENNVVTL